MPDNINNPDISLDKLGFKIKAFPPSVIAVCNMGIKNTNDFEIKLLNGNASIEVEDIDFSGDVEKKVVKPGEKINLPLETKLPVTLVNKAKGLKGSHPYTLTMEVKVGSEVGEVPLTLKKSGTINI